MVLRRQCKVSSSKKDKSEFFFTVTSVSERSRVIITCLDGLVLCGNKWKVGMPSSILPLFGVVINSSLHCWSVLFVCGWIELVYVGAVCLCMYLGRIIVVTIGTLISQKYSLNEDMKMYNQNVLFLLLYTSIITYQANWNGMTILLKIEISCIGN